MLSDLKLQGITERDLDVLLKTHHAVAQKDFIERNDMKIMFESAWEDARQQVFDQQAAR